MEVYYALHSSLVSLPRDLRFNFLLKNSEIVVIDKFHKREMIVEYKENAK